MEKETSNYLGKEKISKLLLKFSIPCILSLLIGALYNIVDQIFIGNSKLGYLGNAATTVVFPITIIATAFAWTFGDGTASFLSIRQGRKDTKSIPQAIANSIMATLAVCVVFIVVNCLFMDKILHAFGASADSIGLATAYFKIILIGMPFYMLQNMFSGIVRADGSPLYSMIAMVIGAVINIILDPILIFVFDMGIEGAAWATIIAQIISCVITLAYLTRTKTFKLKWANFKVNLHLLGSVTKLGGSTFITQMSIVLISLVCNIMLVKYGAQSVYGVDIPIAVIGIAMKVFTIVINIVVGIILGAQPILGYNIGAKNYSRVKKTFMTVLGLTIAVGLVSTVIFEFFPSLIIGVFGTGDALYMEFAVKTFRIFLLLVTFTCVIKMSSIFFQSVGKSVSAAVASLARDIICFIPLLIIVPSLMGVEGALWAAPMADVIGMAVTIGLLIKYFKSLGIETTDTVSTAKIHNSKQGVIITITREHGTAGKYIGELVAKKLKVPYYNKELIAIAAEESGLSEKFISQLDSGKSSPSFKDVYCDTLPAQYAIEAQDEAIRHIAKHGSCVIVERAADYILRGTPNVVNVFIYAPAKYKVSKLKEMYGDTKKEAEKHIARLDRARANYYKQVSGEDWGKVQNYDLCIDSSIGTDETAKIICEYVSKKDLKK